MSCPTTLLFLITTTLWFSFCRSQTWPSLFRRKDRPLSIDGSWSNWHEWGSCYMNVPTADEFYPPWENFLIRSRKRLCDSPTPLHGGKECEPPSHRFIQCPCSNPLLQATNYSSRSVISSSKESYQNYKAENSRFGSEDDGWCANERVTFLSDLYLQVEFSNFVNIGAVATLGMKEGRISSYKLKHSLDGETWENFKADGSEDTVFRGNLLPTKVQKNSFDSHEVVKFVRLYPTKTFGRPCTKLEMYGCVFTCGDVLTSSFGKIVARSSNEFDQNCLWKIHVKNTTSLTFDFNVFYVMCKDGYLDFHDGNYAFSDSPLVARKCLEYEDQEIPLMKLNLNSVWVNFVSNSSLSEVGFNVKYFSECSQTINLTAGEPFSIKTPNFPNDYYNNLDCKWVVYSPISVDKIDIETQALDIESSWNSNTENCNGDYVTIQSFLEGEESVLTKKYCSSNRPASKFSLNADKVIIHFVSDSYTTDKGFSFQLMSGEKLIEKTTSAPYTGSKQNTFTTTTDVIINKQVDSFNSNSTMFHQKVKKDSDDTWTIIIIATFSSFCFLLLMIVLFMNLKRFLNNRNDLNAHCARVLADEKEQKKKLAEKLKHEKMQSGKSPLHVPVHMPQNEEENEPMLKKKVGSEKNESSNDNNLNIKTMSTEITMVDTIQSEHEYPIHDHESKSTTSLDRDSYDSSSPQIHSPSKPMYTNIENNEMEETNI